MNTDRRAIKPSMFSRHYEDSRIASAAASLVGDIWSNSFFDNSVDIELLSSVRSYLYDRADISINFAMLANDLEYLKFLSAEKESF